MEASTLSPTQRIVLLNIINHLGCDSGEAWPSLKRIAKKSGLSRSTVIRCIDHLETVGVLTVTNRTRKDGKSNTSNLYKINDMWEGWCQSDTTPSVTHDTTPSVTGDTPPSVTHDTPYEPPTKEPPRCNLSDHAISIYSCYPKRVGRAAALKAIESALKRVMEEQGVTGDEARQMLTTSVEKFPFDLTRKKRFIPHPSTFFNQERYLDEHSSDDEEQPDDIVEMTRKILAQKEKRNVD